MTLEEMKVQVRREREKLLESRRKGRAAIDAIRTLDDSSNQILIKAAERKMRSLARIIVLFDEFLASPQDCASFSFIEEIFATIDDADRISDGNRRIVERLRESGFLRRKT